MPVIDAASGVNQRTNGMPDHWLNGRGVLAAAAEHPSIRNDRCDRWSVKTTHWHPRFSPGTGVTNRWILTNV